MTKEEKEDIQYFLHKLMEKAVLEAVFTARITTETRRERAEIYRRMAEDYHDYRVEAENDLLMRL